MRITQISKSTYIVKDRESFDAAVHHFRKFNHWSDSVRVMGTVPTKESVVVMGDAYHGNGWTIDTHSTPLSDYVFELKSQLAKIEEYQGAK